MLRSRLTTAAAVLLAAAGVAALPAQAGAATGSVHLYKIYYHSPGTDGGSNYSLNGEWVQITNTTASAVSLKGWTLTDASNHKYVFTAYTLGAHKTVAIDTGKGTDTATHRYQGRAWYVWNNDKDTATLKKPTGATADTCTYNAPNSAYKMC